MLVTEYETSCFREVRFEITMLKIFVSLCLYYKAIYGKRYDVNLSGCVSH